MAYYLRRKDSSIEKGIRRIACGQIDKAIAMIDFADDREEAVHSIRLHCKKLRGLTRIVRPVFKDFRRENVAFRDTARLLSGFRDAKVMQETYDKLVESPDEPFGRSTLEPIRRRFTLERKAELARTGIEVRFDQCREQLATARKRARRWKLSDDGWNAIAGGLIKTYTRASRAAENARKEPNAENYHELRKRLKYHWYHALLLRKLSPKEMRARAASLERISDLLGEHHDLFVFESRIKENPESFGARTNIQMALNLARRRREILGEQTWPIIDRMLAMPPDALADHWQTKWKAWRNI